MAWNGSIIDELEMIWKETVVDSLRCYPGILPGGLKKATKNLSQ
jgi:hypothetical protein